MRERQMKEWERKKVEGATKKMKGEFLYPYIKKEGAAKEMKREVLYPYIKKEDFSFRYKNAF